MKFFIKGCSDKGPIRSNNEDRFGFIETDYGIAAIVCDGMGGYKGGAVAAQIAVDTLINNFISLPQNFEPSKEIINIFKIANDLINKEGIEKPDLSMMGATVALLLIKDNKFMTAHLGDSRVYLLRNNKLLKLTKDHSRVQQLMDELNISYKKASDMTDKNVITRVLGINELSKPDISPAEAIKSGDSFILCTDGLTNFIHDNDIIDIVSGFSPETASEQLVYLAALRGGDDNITAIVIKTESD
ncbi:MAG: serine/threonine-protein phosphatase [Ignavibacterium sp.]|nr:serine/threonine-protein phosphatase [Ignavibacterium sp.]